MALYVRIYEVHQSNCFTKSYSLEIFLKDFTSFFSTNYLHKGTKKQ